VNFTQNFPPKLIKGFIEFYKLLIHHLFLFIFFLNYLTNAEYMISTRSVVTKSTLMIPIKFLCIWS